MQKTLLWVLICGVVTLQGFWLAQYSYRNYRLLANYEAAGVEVTGTILKINRDHARFRKWQQNKYNFDLSMAWTDTEGVPKSNSEIRVTPAYGQQLFDEQATGQTKTIVYLADRPEEPPVLADDLKSQLQKALRRIYLTCGIGCFGLTGFALLFFAPKRLP